jgi:hypothetical protein
MPTHAKPVRSTTHTDLFTECPQRFIFHATDSDHTSSWATFGTFLHGFSTNLHQSGVSCLMAHRLGFAIAIRLLLKVEMVLHLNNCQSIFKTESSTKN